jgi:hypothetical protein
MHFALEVLVVKVEGVDGFRWASGAEFAYAGKNWTNDFFAEDEQPGEGANAEGINAVEPGVSDSLGIRCSAGRLRSQKLCNFV